MSIERQNGAHQAPHSYQRSSQAWTPVLITGAVILVIAALSYHSPSLAQDDEDAATNRSNSFEEVAIMGGVKRENLATSFQRGEATAVMGGVDLDLSRAVMDGREALLDVSSIMGGVKIRVPETWTVVSRVETIMGGFKDKTRRPPNSDHKLILEGTVIMGGLTVSN